MYDLESLFLGFVSNIFAFYRSKKRKKKRNRLVFDNVDISISRMKSAFLCNLWSWANLYVVDRQIFD